MIIFRESLKSENVQPFIILDENRGAYIDSLKEFQEEQKTDKLVELMKKEASVYYEECKYFM